MPVDIVSGSGTRHGIVMLLDTATGLPLPAAASSVPYVGIEIEGIKTATSNDPAPRNVTHQGEDRPYAQDSLPPDTFETFTITTSKTNLSLDAALEGTSVREYTNASMRIANSDKKGSEPRVLAFFYRQALDTQKSSATFGQLRKWNGRTYPAARISPITDEYGKDVTDKTYQGSPTNVGFAPWNEDIAPATWNAKEGAHFEQIFDAQPIPHAWRGDGTILSYSLIVAPRDLAHVLAWADGTVVTPSAVNTSTATPAMTLASPPGKDKLLFAYVMTDNP